MAKLKITVLKRELYKDLIEEYGSDKNLPLCPRVYEGQEFYSDTHGMPEGFCTWAWADLQRDAVAVFNGAGFPWMKDKGIIISACTDGFRPVIFKVERVE